MSNHKLIGLQNFNSETELSWIGRLHNMFVLHRNYLQIYCYASILWGFSRLWLYGHQITLYPQPRICYWQMSVL